MAKHTEYLNAKRALKEVANDAKRELKGDNSAIRQMINDYADYLSKDFPLIISGKRRDLYRGWLSSYSCTLHPKD